MIADFLDRPGQGVHEAFQQWRREHPGCFFLSFKAKSRANLHVDGGCHHPGDAHWPFVEGGGSLTAKRKVCALEVDELGRWAAQHKVEWRWCAHCESKSPATIPAPESKARAPASVRSPPEAPLGAVGTTMRVFEGMMREVTTMAASRNRELRNVALAASRGVCEACRTDFSLLLGGLGVRALQVHHRSQLALLNEPALNGLEDLAVVCANCHSMIHADPAKAMPVAQLRELLSGAR